MSLETPRRKTASLPLRLQLRDYDLLRGLFECRVMTLSHAAILFFDGRIPAATKRLQLLKAAGYLSDRRRRIGEPSVLTLTKKAFEELVSAGALDGYPRLTAEQFSKRSRVEESTLRHELAVMDVKVAVTQAIATSNSMYAIHQFTTWPTLSQFNAIHPDQRQRVTVRPDGFLHAVETGTDGAMSDHRFFLELDRSTESQRLLTDKCLCYRHFYSAGGFAQRCGGQADEFRQYPFRVLLVLQTAERRNNSAERLLNCFPPIKYQAWLTTLAEVLANPLGNIWTCPNDYALATEGTDYAPHRRRDLSFYVRRPERERLVEERLTKRTLFESA
jgi:hypothetical protein